MATAEQMARYRAKKRKAGFCVVCGKRKPRRGKATCKPCNDAAKERVKRSREHT